ncbi:hypothetical protein, partial [Pseudomonas syringae]|uniref:hypothetical protein n=2 Tax=Pseudomonas syringae TaxID=317 RepID=UPI001968965A
PVRCAIHRFKAFELLEANKKAALGSLFCCLRFVCLRAGVRAPGHGLYPNPFELYVDPASTLLQTYRHLPVRSLAGSLFLPQDFRCLSY